MRFKYSNKIKFWKYIYLYIVTLQTRHDDNNQLTGGKKSADKIELVFKNKNVYKLQTSITP